MALFKKNESTSTVDKGDSTTINEVSTKDLYAGPEVKTAKGQKNARKVSATAIARANELMIKPLVTEKVTVLNGLSKYAFEVSLKANKIEVAKAVEALYGIKPFKVNMINLEGKRKNYGHRKGKRSDWKKAIVTLPAGKTIDVYEGV